MVMAARQKLALIYTTSPFQNEDFCCVVIVAQRQAGLRLPCCA